MALENIPHELRSYRQWVRRSADKIPLNPRTGTKADVTDPNTWGTFDEAIASPHGEGVGFVFTNSDPYTGIDLDVKPDEQPTAEQLAIFNEFDSYAEKSPSKRGVHIIVRGKVPTTIKRKGIEVYSALRYFTMTGDVLRPGPIADHSAKLQAMWARMGGNPPQVANLASDATQTASDGEIIDQARNAANGAKFATLYAGNWQGEYPSQSEADQALINIIGFYSKNREQIARIFRSSGLGQRDKAKRSDYMNRMLSKAFDRELKPARINLPNPFEKKSEAKGMMKGGEMLALAETEPETEFICDKLFPVGELTLLSANGGVGKSFYSLQLAIGEASGYGVFGHGSNKSPVLFVSGEDRRKECGKRIAAICKDKNLHLRNQFTKEAHNNFNFWEVVGLPIWRVDSKTQCGEPTETIIELERNIEASGARLVFIDNASSLFYGNHNSLEQVNAFVSYLRNVAERQNCAIVMLAHVSADSANGSTKKDYFGSVAWHNSTRSRMFMELVEERGEIGEHVVVSHTKSNYGKKGNELYKLQRNPETGVLRLLSNHEIAEAIDENISNVAEEVFEDIKAICEKGEFINAATQGPSTSYMNLSQHFPNRYKESDRKHKEEVKCAIRKFADDKRIFKHAELMANRSRKEVWVPVLPPISAQPAETLAQPSNAPKHLFAPIRTDSN